MSSHVDQHASPGTTPRATTGGRPAAPRLLGWDCIELWVGNARAFAGFLMSAFGFRCTAYAGPETGVRDKASYCLLYTSPSPRDLSTSRMPSSA